MLNSVNLRQADSIIAFKFGFRKCGFLCRIEHWPLVSIEEFDDTKHFMDHELKYYKATEVIGLCTNANKIEFICFKERWSLLNFKWQPFEIRR